MENIVLTIDEEVQIENHDHMPLAQVYAELIPDNCLCLSYKINNIDKYDEDDLKGLIANIIKYQKQFSDVFAFTHGIHLNGKSKTPHIHVHFIIASTVTWLKTQTNKSQHRNRWFGNNECWFPPNDLSTKSMSFDKTRPKYDFLAYPLKENRYYPNRKFFELDDEKMTDAMIKFLKDYAASLYEVKIAHDIANEKCEQRNEVKYNEILKIAKNYINTGRYLDFQIYMEENYIEKLISTGENLPDIDKYKKNLKRAAVQLKFFKTYEL